MRIDATRSGMERAIEAGGGVLRLAPAWVPRAMCSPGGRLRLHPDDLYPFGPERGGIDERWLASTVHADNGPGTGEHEGVSLVVGVDGAGIPFDRLVEELGPAVIGDRLWRDHGGWPAYAKLFDNRSPLPLHVHHRDEHAAALGRKGKPEAYYFPPQMNPASDRVDVSFFGLHPETTRAALAERLARFGDGEDNRITELSRGYRLTPGTGWDVPAGVLHAPAAMCTYEPQRASDVACVCESWSDGRPVDPRMLWKDVPADRAGDVDYVLEILDWERNVDPGYRARHLMVPVETRASAAAAGPSRERWIVYLAPHFSARELTVDPGATVTIRDADPYGALVIQGRGSVAGLPVSSASLIRFGALTEDEIFVTAAAARRGVLVRNESDREPLVLLRHFGPGNPELADDARELAALRRDP